MKVLKEKITEFIFGDTDGLVWYPDPDIGEFGIPRQYISGQETAIVTGQLIHQ